MQRDTGDKIDFLMKVTGTSNAQLARALNFDASYISRIRAGKRGLPPHLPFIEPAALFFARNVREGYQAETLAHELGVSGTWPDDAPTAARLIAQWLVGADRGEAYRGQEKSPESAPSNAPQSTRGRAVEARLFFGEAGRREAALAFLQRVADVDAPCELLLQSDEDTAWMYRDAGFVGAWTSLMTRLVHAGCTFTVVHTVSRSGNEMWEGLQEWLPLYLTGAIRPYYYPRLRDGIRARSLFVARGRCALVANSVRDMAGNELCIMLDDPDATTALEREFDAYRALCSPLAQVERSQTSTDFEQLIEDFRKGDTLSARVAGAVVCARPGQDALLASPGTRVIYRVSEPRLVEAIASFIARIPQAPSATPEPGTSKAPPIG